MTLLIPKGLRRWTVTLGTCDSPLPAPASWRNASAEPRLCSPGTPRIQPESLCVWSRQTSEGHVGCHRRQSK